MQHDGQTMKDERVPLTASRLWLRADCDYATQLARFSYSTDGINFLDVGAPFRMVEMGVTFQGVRYAMFSYHLGAGQAGYADFDSFHVTEPAPHANTRAIPYGKKIVLATALDAAALNLVEKGSTIVATSTSGTGFQVVDRKLGRVALRAPQGFISVKQDGSISLQPVSAGPSETFQWVETFTGELTLLSLESGRYLRVKGPDKIVSADAPGPERDGLSGVRFSWRDEKERQVGWRSHIAAGPILRL